MLQNGRSEGDPQADRDNNGHQSHDFQYPDDDLGLGEGLLGVQDRWGVHLKWLVGGKRVQKRGSQSWVGFRTIYLSLNGTFSAAQIHGQGTKTHSHLKYQQRAGDMIWTAGYCPICKYERRKTIQKPPETLSSTPILPCSSTTPSRVHPSNSI